MHVPCQTQLPRLRPSGSIKPVLKHTHIGLRSALLVVCAKRGQQKNEGVYFEYEPVDQEASDEIAAIEEEQEAQFNWAKRSRDTRKALNKRQRSVDRLPTDTLRGPRDGTGRGRNATRPDGAKQQQPTQPTPKAAPPAAPPAAPSPSAAAAPAAQPFDAALDGRLLARPRPVGGQAPGQAAPAAGAPQAAAASRPRPLADAATALPSAARQDEDAPVASGLPGSGGAPGGAAAGDVAGAAGAAAPGRDRRQRLLQRMKGAGGGAAAGDGEAPAAGASAAVGAQPAGADARAAQGVPQVQGGEQRAGGGAAAPAAVPLAAAAATAAAAAATGMDAPSLDGELRRTLAGLAASLPAEDSLPPEALPARALLASILDPAAADSDSAAAAGDVTDMLRGDLAAAAEFRQWLGMRGARGGGGSGRAEGGDEDGGEGAEELTEAEAADLAAALANLDLGDFDLGELMSEGEEEGEQGRGGDGDAAVGDALREVTELRALMAALDGEGPDAGASDGGDGEGADGDMTDEQVLALLRSRDPELAALLADVPEFERLGLGEGLGSGLDGEGMGLEGLMEGGEGEDAAEMAALLRDMRELGLMGGDGAAAGDDDDDFLAGEDGTDDDGEDGDEDEDGEGGMALGDLLEALGEDDELPAPERLRAQYALQSLFNQPADELAAKGEGGSGKEAEKGRGEKAAPPPRGTTGLARQAVRPDDEDGGAAPPPLMPRPKPRR